jgi:TPR repeat protein
MYQKGEGVPQNDAKAMDLYKKAANKGDSDAQYNIGVMYKKGEGVRRNDTEAVTPVRDKRSKKR